MLLRSPLLAFLRTGNLAPLAVGMSRQEVEACLGEPDDVSVAHKPLIWKYGPLQLTFDHTSHYALAGVGLHTIDLDKPLPSALGDLSADPLLSRRTSVQAFETWLEPADAGLARDEDLTFADQIGLRAGPGVSIVFSAEGALLDKIVYLAESGAVRKDPEP